MVKALITQKILEHDSILLAGIYTVGHIFIAMTCTLLITGTSFDLAAMDALIEPVINGFWFYFLHKAWKKITLKASIAED
jgi:uncharacterized membrane protein